MSNAGLQFAVLGPLQLRAGSALVPLGAPKQRAVLGMLVMNRNRAVSVDALIDAVWGESPVPAARTSIHSYVSNLRRLLGSGTRDPNQVLASAPPGYQLNVADADCDLGRFVIEKNAGVHAAAAGRFEDASTCLTAALAEWRGPFLDDLREFAFVDMFATALAEVRVAVQTAHAEAEIACGRADSIIPRLEVLSAEHPFRERLWAQLITAYYVAERQSDALDAYRRLKTNLAENLGIDPGPTVRALHERILRQEALNTARDGADHRDAQRRRPRPAHRHLGGPVGHRRTARQRWPALPVGVVEPDRPPPRQRHRPRRRRRQPVSRGRHWHRRRIRHQRSTVDQRCRGRGPPHPRQRHLGRRRPDPHRQPPVHVRDSSSLNC